MDVSGNIINRRSNTASKDKSGADGLEKPVNKAGPTSGRGLMVASAMLIIGLASEYL